MIFADAFALISVMGALIAVVISAIMYLQVLASRAALKSKVNYRNLMAIHEFIFPQSKLRRTRMAADYLMVSAISLFAILRIWISHK